MKSCTFRSELKKMKRPTPKKFFIFQEMELSSSNVKTFQKTETPKICFTFQEAET